MPDPHDPDAEQADRELRDALPDESDEVFSGFIPFLMTEATPEDRHRFALGANWDFVEPAIFRWIVTRPDCDRATALELFWLAQPGFDVEHPELARPDDDERLILSLIRRRWREGRYPQSEFAFDLDATAMLDFADLDRRFGARATELMPPDMRVDLGGRRIEMGDAIDGVPARFWSEELR